MLNRSVIAPDANLDFPVSYLECSSGRVAQLVRAPASHAGGHRFESCRAHHPGTCESATCNFDP